MKIFVPVAWPYVNGELHLGHFAGSFLAPDIFSRFHRQRGNDVLMVSGSDMHGTPTLIAAENEGLEPAEVAQKYHARHVELLKKLGIFFNLYTNTETENHREIVQTLFLDLLKKGLLVKKKEKQFWTEAEKKYLLDRFIEGECPHCHYKDARGDQCDSCGRTLKPTDLINPRSRSGDKNLVLKETEDYYLDLPALQKDIEDWLDKHPNIENWRENVVKFTKAWLREGLKARPITRDLPFGLELPQQVDLERKDEKVIYVWFEAVTGYWSAAVEWSKRVSGQIKGGENNIIFYKMKGQSTSWKDYWHNKSCKHYYFMGKDNIVFHTIIWPAMLLGWNRERTAKEKLQLAYDIPANAYLNLEGAKMSKSRHWFVSLRYLLETYGQDLVRFYFALRMPENKDSDFKWKDFVDVNNHELVANLGNFIHRTLSFIESKFDGVIPKGKLENEVRFEIRDAFEDIEGLVESVKICESLARILRLVSFANKYFDKKAVWKVVKKDKKTAGDILYNCVQIIEALRVVLSPFLPTAVQRLTETLVQSQMEWKVGDNNWKFEEIKAGRKLGKVSVLFSKLDDKVAQIEKAKLVKGSNEAG